MHKINITTKKFLEAVTIDLGQLPTVDTRIDFILTDGTNPVIAENKTFSMTIGSVLGSLYKTDADTVSFRYLKFNDDNIADSLVITMTMDGVEILNDVISLKYQRECVDKDALEEAINAKADKATTIAGYGIADAYTKSEVDAKVSSVYHYKGTVSAYADLPASGQEIGDVWNIETADSTHGIKAGDNVAWTGSEWDVLAGEIDLSAYATKTELETKMDAPATGTVGQVLTKTADGQEWADAPAGGGGEDTTDYLCFEATGTTKFRLNKYYYPDPIDMEYSTDKKTWIPYTWDSVQGAYGSYEGATINLKVGDKVWWRGNNDHFSKGRVGDYNYRYSFYSNGNVRVSGVLMSLLDKTCKSVTIPTEYCFVNLFAGQFTFTSDFKIQALYYKRYCFQSMLGGSSTYFEKVPVFKGAVAQYCFSKLFMNSEIKSIDFTEVFPNMEVSNNTDCAYSCMEMLSGCNKLKHIKVNFNNWFSRYQFSLWLSGASSTCVFECPSTLDCSIRDASHVPAGWTIVRTDAPKSITSPTTASSEATYQVSPNTPSVPVVTVASALTLNASTVDSGSVAYAEIVLDVAEGATVTAGTNLTLVDTPTAGKRNICVCRWSGGACKLYVTIVEDLPQA